METSTETRKTDWTHYKWTKQCSHKCH